MGLYWSANAPNYTNKRSADAAEGPRGGPGRPLATPKHPPKKSSALPRIFTGNHSGPLGTAGMAGMPPPHFSLGSCPTFGGVGVGMAGVFLDCIPKCLPHALEVYTYVKVLH